MLKGFEGLYKLLTLVRLLLNLNLFIHFGNNPDHGIINDLNRLNVPKSDFSLHNLAHQINN